MDGTVTKWIKAEKPAKYYGEAPPEGWDDYHVPDLVKETLATVGKKIKGHEDKYDQRDPYDLDGDGNVMEPDGLLDNLFLVHAGPGGDTGGGVLGPNDAIWPRRSWLDKPTSIPGTSLKALDYIIQPENGAIGVFSHEYGHNLGLPDEYDTTNVGADSPISRWSVMAAGSWAGKTPGTEPSGFSPWAKLFLRNVYGGKWPAASVINLDDVKGEKRVKIKEAVADSSQGKIVKINLPDVPRYPATEPIGKESYFSERGNDLDTKLTSDEIELPDGKQIALSFDSWRDIEIDYDFFYVNLYEGESKDPIRLIKFSDTTDKKWVQESIDLTPYAGKKVVLEFEYVTDTNTAMEGVFLDQIKVDVDGETLLEDDADGKDSYFTQNGFTTIDGTPTYYPNYYMLEWRTHNGVDVGLAHSVTRSGMFAYDPGLVIWYYDGRYGKENFVSQHPGHGFLGVVDAHQTNIVWNDGWVERSFYQIKDAAFNVKDTSPFRLVSVKNGAILEYNSEPGVKTFSDDLDYSNPFQPESGKILPVNGLSISIDKVNKYENEVYITISKK
ncbi:MAG: immune inhibitor A domain-containing protein [Clostridia bacterium]